MVFNLLQLQRIMILRTYMVLVLLHIQSIMVLMTCGISSTFTEHYGTDDIYDVMFMKSPLSLLIGIGIPKVIIIEPELYSQ